MSLIYSGDQKHIAEQANRFLSSRYDNQALKENLSFPGCYDRGLQASFADLGWTALAIPEEFGGVGLGLVDLCIVAEASGRVAVGTPFIVCADAFATALIEGGDANLRSEYLGRLVEGELTGTVAFGPAGDPLSFNDAPRCDGNALTGIARAAMGAAFADVAIVPALSADGAALALVELDSNGVTRSPVAGYDNSRGFADLGFDGAPARLLTVGEADAVLWRVLRRAAVVMAAEQVGGADICMESSRDYANVRQAFGQPIGKFQAVKHRIAEMYVAAQISRANCLEAARRIDADMAGADAMAAAARISAIQAYDFASREAVQIHGGIGVTWENDLHLHLRRARSTASALGNQMFWEDRLVDLLEKQQ